MNRSPTRTVSNRSCATSTKKKKIGSMTTTTATESTTVARVADEIRKRQRFVITSHVRPDGDAIGSSLAMAYALRELGKDVRVVFRDAPPPPLLAFPGVGEIDITDR